MIRQDGIVHWNGRQYRVTSGNTAQPRVYVRVPVKPRVMRAMNVGIVERRLNPNGATALNVVSLFRNLTRPGDFRRQDGFITY